MGFASHFLPKVDLKQAGDETVEFVYGILFIHVGMLFRHIKY